ncbi:MAG TPA: hypothetical protein VF622_01110 [Segetibacter sp.]|jgi:hypothetical protein
MINSISWASYGYALTISLFIYYLIIGFVYYKDDIRQLLSGRQSALQFTKGEYMPAPSAEGDKGLFSIVQNLADEIEAFFQEASGQNYGKGELLSSIRLLVSKYPVVASTSYETYINSIIKKNIQVYCSITIGDDDIKGVWIER